jgi:diguanylate cyclase (GGDEF)-like protein/PAS domain S-box-containing protein
VYKLKLLKKYLNPSIRIISIYFLFGILWVFFSDWLLTKFIPTPDYLGTHSIEIFKGCFFVVLTSWVFYQLINKNFKNIHESEDRYRKLVENSPEIILVHIDGEIVYVNQAGVNFVGAENPTAIIGKQILDFVTNDEYDYTVSRMKKVKEEGKIELAEQKALLPNGHQVSIETMAFKTTFQEKEAVQVIVRDITEQKSAAEKINYLAYYDTLTRLPNRNALNKYIENMINTKENFAVMLLDLDRFKNINDNLGHAVGDRLLKQVSRRLMECLEAETFISRYGGDEFVILLESARHEKATKAARAIIEELSQAFLVEKNEFYITPSIGISIYPIDGTQAEELIKNADTAMYAAKDGGRNNYRFFDYKLNKENQRKMDLEQGIRKALKNEEFQLFYQPQINLKTGEVIGVEALIRWQHPIEGMISPSEFIPIAEDTGLIVKLGEWVLETACKQLKIWQLKGLPYIRVAVNVSVHQFHSKHFVNKVAEILLKTGVNPKFLELEITESVIREQAESTRIMEQLKELGLEIAIDDFGTGYSSLSVLKYLPIDNIKIDKSFLDDINVKDDSIVKTIIQMGKNLNFTIVAEGIEHKHQLSLLKKYKCHIGQGYYFSKPLPPEKIEDLLKEFKKFI